MVSEGRQPEEARERRRSNLERFLEDIDAHANVSAVFGARIEGNGVTVVPVARVRWAVGGGGGTGPQGERGLGRGGAVEARPVGFIELRDGAAYFRRLEPALGLWKLLVGLGMGAYLWSLGSARRHRRSSWW